MQGAQSGDTQSLESTPNSAAKLHIPPDHRFRNDLPERLINLGIVRKRAPLLNEGGRDTSAHSFCRAGHDGGCILDAHDAMI